MKRTWLATLVVPVALIGAAATPASAAPPLDQSFTITLDVANPTAPGAVVATGALNETGTYTLISSRGAGKTAHNLGTVTLSGGTLEVKSVSIRIKRAIDSATCTRVDKGIGVWKFNKGKGTGVYVTTKGHGHYSYTETATGVSDGNGGCDFSAATGTHTVTGSGKVKP